MISRALTLCLAAGLAALSAAPAQAFGGKSDNGDSYLNDAQKNPRFIEPYAWADPARYRASNPWAGYGDRAEAARGDVAPDTFRRDYRGRVTVQPYR